MILAVIMDALTILVLVSATIYGSWRGFFRSIAGLLAAILALVGAGMVANTYTEPLAESLVPKLEERIERKIEKAVQEHAAAEEQADPNQFSLETLLDMLGLDQEVRESMEEKAQERIVETGESVMSAVVNSLARNLIYGGLFLLAFLAMVLLLKGAIFLIDKSLKVPVLDNLNMFGGMLLGLVEGALLLFLGIWVLRHLGFNFSTELIAHTHVLRFFATHTPLDVLAFLG